MKSMMGTILAYITFGGAMFGAVYLLLNDKPVQLRDCIERQPLKKLGVDEDALLRLLLRWQDEAKEAGRQIDRIAVAFEAGRDGFWLARWLRAHDIEAHVIHASSVAVSREHRRAKTDRLDTEMLKRAFLGWLRGERDHCKMVAIPTCQAEESGHRQEGRGPQIACRDAPGVPEGGQVVAAGEPQDGRAAQLPRVQCQVGGSGQLNERGRGSAPERSDREVEHLHSNRVYENA